MNKLCESDKLQPLEEYVSRLSEAALQAELASCSAPFGHTPLHVAALSGHASILKFLLSKGGDANSRSSAGGSTPLHLAASRGHLQCVRLLVGHGANATIKDARGRTPVECADCGARSELAAAIRSEEIVRTASGSSCRLRELLEPESSDLEPNCLSRALMAAVRSDHVANVGALVRKGAGSAENIHDALLVAKSEGKHKSRALLLLVKAAMSNDVDLVLNLYGPPTNVVESLSVFDVQLEIAKGEIPTDVALEIAGRYGNTSVKEELLLRTEATPTKGHVLWHALHLSALHAEWLQRIPLVVHLRLDHNNLQTLPSNLGPAIQRVTKLELQFNHLESIPGCLLELPCLSELNLSHNRLGDLPQVPLWSPALTTLDLSHNYLTTISGDSDANGLEVLNLSYNRLTALPTCLLFGFVSLQALDLSYNNIGKLPEDLRGLKDLITLNLNGLTCIRGGGDSNYGDKVSCHLKMVLLGDKGTGKSTLVSLLTHSDLTTDTVPTSIRIHDWGVPLTSPPLVLSIWDFNDLDAHYDIIQCFLTRGSMYLLLFDVRDPWDTVGGVLVPWLEVLAQWVEQSYVLVVGTHADLLPVGEEQEEVELTLREVSRVLEQFRDKLQVGRKVLVTGLSTGEQGAGPGVGLDQLREAIVDSTLPLLQGSGRTVAAWGVPSGYHRGREVAMGLYREVQRGEGHGPIVNLVEFGRIMQSSGIVSEGEVEEMVTSYLAPVGPLLHFRCPHSTSFQVVLDPGWLYGALSALFKCPAMFKGTLCTSGLVTLAVPHAQEHLDLLLSLLVMHDIAVPMTVDLLLVTPLLPPCPPSSPLSLPPCSLSSLSPHTEGTSVDAVKGEWPYVRYFVLRNTPTTSFWTRLLSSVAHAVPRMQSAADGLWGSCLLPQAGSGDHTMPHSRTSSTSVVHFCRNGVHYVDPEVTFWVESLSHSGVLTHEHKEGVLIVVSATDLGRNLIGLLCDVTTTIITDYCLSESTQKGSWKEGQLGGVATGGRGSWEEAIPCPLCIRMGRPLPFEFHLEHCILAMMQGKEVMECDCSTGSHVTALRDLAPDLFLADIKPQYHLDASSLHIQWDLMVAVGTFSTICAGTYRGSTVTIRRPAHGGPAPNVNGDTFRSLRREALLLQALDHPCVARLVGVCPIASVGGAVLVLDHAPHGPLDEVLLQHRLHRVTLHRMGAEVGAALAYLHEQGTVVLNLRASSVLVWSLDPEALIHCKLSHLDRARRLWTPSTYCAAPSSSNGSVPAPETLSQGRCGHKTDMFSFGMFLYHMITCHEAFQGVGREKVEAAIRRGKRPKLSASHPQTFPYLTTLLQQCWDQSPGCRPSASEAVQQLCTCSVQCMVGITHLREHSLLQSCCVVTQSDFDFFNIPSHDTELWYCYDGEQGTSIKTYSISTKTFVKEILVAENQVQMMGVCGDHVWVSSWAGVGCGRLDLYHTGSRELAHTIPTRESLVTCITCSNRLVYCGTLEGRCLVFPRDVRTLGTSPCLHEREVSCHAVEGVAFDGECLWVSAGPSILFLDLCTLVSVGDPLLSGKEEGVGQLRLLPEEGKVWSYRLGSAYLSAWDKQGKCHLFDVGAREHLKGISTCPQHDMVITAMTLATEVVWVGMATGHILVFHDQEMLLWFHPYTNHIKFLLSYEVSSSSSSNNGRSTYIVSASSGFQWSDPYSGMIRGREGGGGCVGDMEILVTWEAFCPRLCRQLDLLGKRSATFCSDGHFVREMLHKGLFRAEPDKEANAFSRQYGGLEERRSKSPNGPDESKVPGPGTLDVSTSLLSYSYSTALPVGFPPPS